MYLLQLRVLFFGCQAAALGLLGAGRGNPRYQPYPGAPGHSQQGGLGRGRGAYHSVHAVDRRPKQLQVTGFAIAQAQELEAFFKVSVA